MALSYRIGHRFEFQEPSGASIPSGATWKISEDGKRVMLPSVVFGTHRINIGDVVSREGKNVLEKVLESLAKSPTQMKHLPP